MISLIFLIYNACTAAAMSIATAAIETVCDYAPLHSSGLFLSMIVESKGKGEEEHTYTS